MQIKNCKMQSHANIKLVDCIVMSAAFKLFEFSAKMRRTISESYTCLNRIGQKSPHLALEIVLELSRFDSKSHNVQKADQLLTNS